MYKLIGGVAISIVIVAGLSWRPWQHIATVSAAPVAAITSAAQVVSDVSACAVGDYSENAYGEPGGTKADEKQASEDPTQYAWRLFTFLNQQAKADEPGVPDPNKQPWTNPDDNVDVVWESWALASGEVFLADGQNPGPWGGWPRSGAPPRKKGLSRGLTLGAAERAVEVSHLRAALGSPAPMPPLSAADRALLASVQLTALPIDNSITNQDNQEVRMNRSAYETIRTGGLYNQKGIAKAAAAHRACFVTFNRAAKEIKAAWLHFTECDVYEFAPDCLARKSSYHWRRIQNGNLVQIWGLEGMHIISKDLPTWFWADFIHRDCEVDQLCKPTKFQSQTSPLGAPNSAKQTGTVIWDNYQLRGTETGFMRDGQNATLFNPMIDGKAGPESSCITCHAYASALVMRSQALGSPSQLQDTGSGFPAECKFHNNCGQAAASRNSRQTRIFSQSDFVWSMILRAK
jgi:hypothetical protein